MSKSQSKKLNILNLILNTFENSSIHAIPNIVRNESYLIKLMWIIFLFGSTGYCSFLVYQSVMNYMNFDVVSLNRMNPKISVQFPIVTICNMNEFATSYSKELMESIMNESLYENKDLKKSHKINLMSKKYRATLNSINLNKETQSKLGFNLNQTLLSCLYNYADCSINEDIEQLYDIFYGNCLRFNSKQLIKQSIPGPSNALQLELFSDLANEKNSIYSMYNGFKIFISDDKNSNNFYSEGIKIPLGFSTDIILNRYIIKKMPNPYSECINLQNINSYDSEYFKLTFKFYNQSYKQTNCKDICFQIALIKKCQCVDFTSGPSPDPSLEQCLNETNQACMYDLWQEFLEMDRLSKCNCPSECNLSYFIYTTSITNYPSEPYVNYILTYPNIKSKFPDNVNLTYEYLKNRLAAVNVFFNDLSETEITEEAKMVLPDLISNIGGILGLFLGKLHTNFL
jgi:hypothetical protein